MDPQTHQTTDTTNGSAPATVPGQAPDMERLIKDATDKAAANARRAAEADAGKRTAAAVEAARLDLLKRFGVESDDDVEALADRLAKERAAKADSDTESRWAKQLKQQEAKVAELQRQVEASGARERAAVERRLWAEGSSAVLKGAEGLAINPSQVLRILDDVIAVDAESGEIGIVAPDGTDDPPWLDDFKGSDGIAKFVRDWLVKDDQANLRRPAGLQGAGSVAPSGAGVSAELAAKEQKLVALREQNRKGDRRAGDAAVALATEIKRIKAAALTAR